MPAQKDVAPPRGVLLQCLSYYLPNVSGLTFCAVEIGRAVQQRGYRSRVLTSRRADTAAREILDGTEVIRTATPGHLGKAPVMPLLALDAWRAMRDVGVVAIHLPNADAALLAIVARLRGCRLLLQYHCGLSTDGPAERMARALAGLSHLVAGALAQRIQVVAPDYAAQSVFCRLFRRKLHFAPPPVMRHMLYPVDPPPARPRGTPLRIGYVGRLSRQKNLPMLLDAFDGLDAVVGAPVSLELVGPARDVVGEDTWRSVLARVASDDRICHRPHLANGDLCRFFASLDVLVLPSTDRQESFGLVQVEAMIQGTPVVAFDLPGSNGPVRRTGMGRLSPTVSADALRQTIAEVLMKGPPQVASADDLRALYDPHITCAMYLETLDNA